MSATPTTSALKSLHPDLRRSLQRLDSLERQAQQTRASRWRAPPPANRENDGWLISYLDIVTLLLVMLVVLLAISRMHGTRAEASATPSLAAPLAALTADTPSTEHPIATGSGTTALPAVAASTPNDAAPPAITPEQPRAAEAVEPAVAGMTTPASAPQSTLPDAPLIAMPAATTPHDPTSPRQTPSAARTPASDPAGASAPSAGTPPPPVASTAAPTPGAPAFPALALVEDGPWIGTRLRLPDPAQPSRWSLPGFATLAEQTPPPTAIDTVPPEPAQPAPPSVEGLGLGELGDGIDVIVNAQSVSFRISNEILFPSGQADLALTGSDVLDRLANVLARNPYPLSIEGHTDIIPIQNDRFASNWELATARATSVVRYLSRHGIASDRMRAVGYAHTRPLTTNDTPQGRSTNRRVELIMDIPPAR